MSHCIDPNGIVTRWLRKEKDRQAVLTYLVELFCFDLQYTEKEVNEILKAHHSFEDWALLRRELFERELLDRDPVKSLYWRKGNKKIL